MKNKAFSILETLITITILGITFQIVSKIHMKSLLTIGKWRSEIDRIFIVKEQLTLFFIKPPEKMKPYKDKVEHPSLNITSEPKEISRRSSLRKYEPFLNIMESEGLWDKDKTISILTLVPTSERHEK